MNFQEKKLYHQIHPVKLLTDWIAGVISLYFLWNHQFLIALVIMIVPSVIISIVIIKYVDLNNLKNSTFGIYMQQFMTKSMEIIRFLGFAIMVIGAWLNIIWLIIVGLIIILFGWLRGIVFMK